jgi:glycosyltransferase involved in cell wall biosynthesis
MSESLKMLLVTSNFPPEVGGPAKFTSDFASWLRGREIDCLVITTTPETKVSNVNPTNLISVSRNQSYVVRFFRTSFCMARKGKGRNSLVNGLFYEALFANFFLGFRFTAKVPSDIVWDRARNRGKTNFSVDEYQGKERGFYVLQRWLFVRSLKAAKRVIVPSKHLGKLVSDWGIKPEKIELIRNSQNVPKDKPHLKATFDVISVGRLIPLKGNSELILICAKLGLSLRILGEGPEELELKALASRYAGLVEFLGPQSTVEVISQIHKSRVFVLNSSHEGSPNALIEAMAQGAVCVVRSNPGTDELIDDLHNGILVGKQRSLMEALEMAIYDEKLREQVSNGAFTFALNELNQDINFKRILTACE